MRNNRDSKKPHWTALWNTLTKMKNLELQWAWKEGNSTKLDVRKVETFLMCYRNFKK